MRALKLDAPRLCGGCVSQCGRHCRYYDEVHQQVEKRSYITVHLRKKFLFILVHYERTQKRSFNFIQKGEVKWNFFFGGLPVHRLPFFPCVRVEKQRRTFTFRDREKRPSLSLSRKDFGVLEEKARLMPVSHYRGSPADPLRIPCGSPADPLRIPSGSPWSQSIHLGDPVGIRRGSAGDPQGICSSVHFFERLTLKDVMPVCHTRPNPLRIPCGSPADPLRIPLELKHNQGETSGDSQEILYLQCDILLERKKVGVHFKCRLFFAASVDVFTLDVINNKLKCLSQVCESINRGG